jgi:hypothetical protein
MEPVSAPSNYRDPEKIAAYIAEREAEQRDRLALDLDLCRVTCLSWLRSDGSGSPVTMQAMNETQERELLGQAASWVGGTTFVTFGGRAFDLLVLQRRARYIGMTFPFINTDRYRSPHVDLMEKLADGDRARMRSLNFYCRRLGWTDLADKPLSGEDESRVFETGDWDRLRESVRRDVRAIHRLAQWAGVIAKSPEPEPIL